MSALLEQHFDLPNVHDDEPQAEYPCQLLVDLGEHCGKPITCIVEEPYTPGRFKIECCDECAKGFMAFGYSGQRYCPGVSQTCDTLIPIKDEICARCRREANGEGPQ